MGFEDMLLIAEPADAMNYGSSFWLLSSLDSRGRRHSRHVGGSDALGHACAQSGEPIKIGYSMSVTGGLAPDGRSSAARAENLGRGDKR